MLERLTAGEELREAAQRLGVSVHTVRSQLKAVLRKTGRSNQAQLLGLVNRMATIAPRADQSEERPQG